MKRAGSSQTGFTIVETMIFLAVSGALLASAMLLIGGQQQKTQFNSALHDLDTELQTVMGNVASGYYANTGNTRCLKNVGGTAIQTLDNSGAAGSQGKNSDCEFIGAVIVPPTAPNKTDFKVYSVVGLRQDATVTPPQDVTTLAKASPELFITPPAAQTYSLNGADFGWIEYDGSTPTDSIGFMTSFVQYSGVYLGSGSRSTNTYAIDSADPNPGPAGIADDLRINGDLGTAHTIKNPDNITICIQDGTRHGLVTVSGGSTQTQISPGNCP